MNYFQITKTVCDRKPEKEHDLITEGQNYTLNHGRAMSMGYRSVEFRNNTANGETYVLFSTEDAPEHLLDQSVIMMPKPL